MPMNSRHALLVFLLLALLALRRRLRDRGAAAARHPGRSDDAVRRRGEARRGAAPRDGEPRRVDGRHRRVRRRVRVQLTRRRRRPVAVVFAATLAGARRRDGERARAGRGARHVAHASSTRRRRGRTCSSTRRRRTSQASPWRWLDVRGGWEADVVSGASVATKAGPRYGAAPRRRRHAPPACTTSATWAAARSRSTATRRRSPPATRTAPSTTTGRTRCT